MSLSPAPRRARRLGFYASLLIHAILLTAAIAIPLRYFRDQPSSGEATQLAPVESTSDAPDLKELSPTEQAEPDPFSQAAQDAHMEKQFDSQLADAIDSAAQQGEETNRNELYRLTRKLDRYSSQQSVDEMATRVNTWSGVQPRKSTPAEEPVAGKFDFRSAQVHEVTRSEQPDGGFRYRSVMIDAAGRTYEVDLDEETGRSLYRTMEMVKSSPLLESVYRQMAIPLLDKLISAQEAFESAAAQAEANPPIHESPPNESP